MSRWSLVYLDYDPAEEGHREALCAVGNGYFVTRGAGAECKANDVHYPGTYVAGLYDRLRTDMAGREVENEDLVNIPNWLPLTFRVDDGPWFHIDTVTVLDYRVELDMRRGVLNRRVRFEDGDGRISQVGEQRFVHMRYRHVAALETTIRAVNWAGRLTVRSALDGTVVNDGVARYRDLAQRHLVPRRTTTPAPETMALEVETAESEIRIAVAARTTVMRDGAPMTATRDSHADEGYISQDVRLDLGEGEAVSVEKIVSVFTSRDNAIADPHLEAVMRTRRCGDFATLLAPHVLEWDRLWRRFGVHLGDGEEVNAALSLHVFHLLQTVSPNSMDIDAGVPARGWHGEAYRCWAAPRASPSRR